MHFPREYLTSRAVAHNRRDVIPLTLQAVVGSYYGPPQVMSGCKRSFSPLLLVKVNLQLQVFRMSVLKEVFSSKEYPSHPKPPHHVKVILIVFVWSPDRAPKGFYLGPSFRQIPEYSTSEENEQGAFNEGLPSPATAT